MKIERAKLEIVISVKVLPGDDTPENPVRAMRLYFLLNGTFIGEVDESAARCVMGDNAFLMVIGGAQVCYDILLNQIQKSPKKTSRSLLPRLPKNLPTILRLPCVLASSQLELEEVCCGVFT